MDKRFSEVGANILELLKHRKNLILSTSFPATVTRFILIVEYSNYRGFPKDVATLLENIAEHHEDVASTRCDITLFILTFHTKEKRDKWREFFEKVKNDDSFFNKIERSEEESLRIFREYMLL